MYRYTAVLLIAIMLLLTGCGTVHYVSFKPKTDPKLERVYAKGQSRSNPGKVYGNKPSGSGVSRPYLSGSQQKDTFTYIVTSEDMSRKQIQLPTLILETPGYTPFEYQPPLIPIDQNFYSNIAKKELYSDWKYYWHSYENTRSIPLQPVPIYSDSSAIPNQIQISISSEPQGARIYQKNRLVGTTPFKLNYTINNDCYISGEFSDTPLLAVRDGYISQEQTPHINIKPDWKYKKGSTFESGMLFFLKPTPNKTELLSDSYKQKGETLNLQKQDTNLSVTNSTNSINGAQWAVVIGISKYQYSGQSGLNNLVFADEDAEAFARSLRNLGWSDNHIKLLTNEEATQRNIMIALESWLSKASPDDQIILFWAGHGFPNPEDPEKVYFACYDTDIRIPATGYRMDQVRRILEERRSKNVILFADTCHAGKLITRGDDTRSISIIPNIRKQSIPKGWIFMIGADTDRQAIEHSSWRNGAFTYSLIKGLNGGADGFQSAGAKDGVVTMGELKDFMKTSMPEETQKVLGVAKHPVITTSTGDPEIWNLTLEVK